MAQNSWFLASSSSGSWFMKEVLEPRGMFLKGQTNENQLAGGLSEVI